MDLLKMARAELKKAKRRMATFEKHGISNKAQESLEIKMHLIGSSGNRKNDFSLTKDMSQAQLKQALYALQYFNNSYTYRQYMKEGKAIARELTGKKRVSESEAIGYMELLERADDYIRDEYIYEAISRENMHDIIATADDSVSGNAMKIKLFQAIEQQGRNVDLSNTLDMLGLDISDIMK